MFISYDPNTGFPQIPQPGVGVAHIDGSHTPPDGLVSFFVDRDTLEHGYRNEDVERFYEITAPGVLTPKDQALIDSIRLAEQKETALTKVRADANAHVEATWPIWRQLNADAGIYPFEVKTQKDSDIAEVITESNRVEDLIDASTDIAEVDVALASLNWPVIGA